MKRDEITDAEWLMLQIERVDGCERTKQAVKDILRGMVGTRLTISRRAAVAPARMEHAIRLLDAGNSVAQVRDAIMARECCSRPSAYRVISAALSERGKRHPLATADQFRAAVTRLTVTGDPDA